MFGLNQSMACRMQEHSQNTKKELAMLDGIKDAAAQIKFDPISERMAATVTANMRMAAMSVALQTALILDEGQNEDNEMLPNELLDSLTLEVFDEDGEDEDSDIDANVKAILSANIADAFSSLGVDDGVIEDMFSTDLDVADTAIESACATVIENLPADGEPLDEFIEQFVYGYDTDSDAENEEGYDGVMFDKTDGRVKRTVIHGSNGNFGKGNKRVKAKLGATVIKHSSHGNIKYKGVLVMRHGEPVTINKRISGSIVLSGKQKSALKKARAKSHSGKAMASRLISIKRGINQVYQKTMGEKGLNFMKQLTGG